jgi:hypothetical protein
MTTIKFKKEPIQQLIDSDLFDKWLANFKKQWSAETNTSGNGKSIEYFEECDDPYELISYGFAWEDSFEGYFFWNSVHSKPLQMINKV